MEENKHVFTIFSYSKLFQYFTGSVLREKLVFPQQLLLESSDSLSFLIFPHFVSNSNISYLPLVFLAVQYPNLAVILYSWRGWRKQTQLESISASNANKNYNYGIDFIFWGKNSEKKNKLKIVPPLCQNLTGSTWRFLRWRVDSRASHFISILNELEEPLINLSPFNEFFIALNCSR